MKKWVGGYIIHLFSGPQIYIVFHTKCVSAYGNAYYRESLFTIVAFDGRRAIIDIDDDEKTVYFDTYKLKKITGTRVAPILGIGEFSSPFKVACELAGLYPGDRANKYTEAGNIAEPLIRDYAKASSDRIAGLLGYGPVIIEDPVPGESCGYDHFHNEKLFGGLVDGYIVNGGKRSAVLEIKTSSSRERWEDSDGGYS